MATRSPANILGYWRRPEATSAAILAHVRTQWADFKVPRRVEFVAELPRTPSGKIQKHIRREPFWWGCSRRVN
ncbi:MAG: fatty-acyl-CoA synthase [Planctomycetota bacterium]|jgi:fatty-acyl-CoA synthase